MSNTIELRHEFYETDDKVIISIFDKNADPDEITVNFCPRRLTYEHGDKKLVLDPLTGNIDPAECGFIVGKVKVEVCLKKKYQGRWTRLVDQDAPATSSASTKTQSSVRVGSRKNWAGIAEDAINAEPEKTLADDPNAGGDLALQTFFQTLFKDADEDTRRAMMKSYQESGGTTLSTNWAEVGKQKVEVKPPEGSEWKKWG